MKHHHKKRLLKLADFLDKLQKEKFNFKYFTIETGKPMLEALKASDQACGTTACALGWLPAIFPRDIRWYIGKYGKPVSIQHKKSGQISFGVVGEFFGITLEESWKLFDPNSSELGDDASPKEVSAHIHKFLARQP